MSRPPLAGRTAGWKPSETLAVMAEARRRRAMGQDIIDFGPGEPDFTTPQPIIDAAHQALNDGFTHYTPTPGIPELRDAIASRYRNDTGASYEAANAICGCGGKQLLWEVFQSLFQEGDEILLPAPYWVSFPAQLSMAGATAVPVPSAADAGFVPEVDALMAACTDRTRGIVINSPSNPSGAVWSQEVLDAAGDLALAKNLWIITDETYDRFLYDGAQHYSLASRKDLADRLVVINSFSKTYAMTGWRLGYALAPTEVVEPVQRLQSQLTSGPNSVTQIAALAALRDEGGLVTAAVQHMLAAFSRRRSLMLSGLEKVNGASCLPPQGAFYALPDMRPAMKTLGVTDDAALAKRLIQDAGLAVVPGSAFGAPGFVRLSFAVSDEEIKRGLDRLAECLIS